MRKVKLRKSQFDDLVYPACASGSAENMQELEVGVRVLKKMHDPKVAVEEVIPDHILAEYAKARQKAVPQRYLIGPEHTFSFEEDEFRYVLDRCKKHIHRVNMIAAVEMYDIIQLLESTKITPDGVSEDAVEKEP